jgi:DNA-binding LytR/AlgR family response regulator
VLFFDIRMPGLDGLEAAASVAEQWPDGRPFPALVFVTAYDQYAVQAFDAEAVDYLLKPVLRERLLKTVAKLQAALGLRAQQAAPDFDATLAQLRNLLGAQAFAPVATAPLQLIQASLGSQIHMVPVAEVVYFEAADKYVRVLTTQHEYTVRTPLKELLPRLPANVFWQIHRSTLVRAASVARVWRDEGGKQFVALRERPEKLAVSRLYAHLFKAM